MRKGLEKLSILTLLIIIPSLQIQAQNFDCDLALIICSDSTINFRPDGGGINDFLNPNNDSGCFVPEPSPGLPPENFFEQASGWFYFEFRKDMPDSSIIEFAITPILLGPNDVSDYDFAIYGPNVRCDSLGSPKRCSFVNGNCAFCPDTGLGNGEIDLSEDTWVPGNNANGFVAPMVVNPGEGFFLFLEYFEGDSPVDQTQFDLSWGGSAAPFLNCIANPFCYKASAEAGRDTSVCAGSSIQLFGSAINAFGRESYIWSGDNGATSWLDDPFSTTPTVNIPIDFSGRVVFELLIEEGNCEKYDSVVIDVIAYPPLNINGDNFICEGEQVTLDATLGFESYLWSNGDTSTSITVDQGGSYDLTVTNTLGCERVSSFTVFMEKFPDPIIIGDPGFCVGDSATLMTDTEYASYQWSTGEQSPTIQVNQVGTYEVIVTTKLGGCVGMESINVIEFPEPNTEISGDLDLCPNELSTLSVVDTFASYIWSTGANSPDIDIGVEGQYFVEATDTNGCSVRDTVVATRLQAPVPILPTMDNFCPGDTVLLEPGGGFNSYAWSNGQNSENLEISQPGNYSVTVTDAFGCKGQATAVLDTFSLPQSNLLDQYGICDGKNITLNAGNFNQVKWSTGSTTNAINVDTEGIYSVTFTDNNGCSNTDAAFVDVFELPVPLITGDTTICGGEQANLVVPDNFVSYQWSSGETTRSIITSLPGVYEISVTDNRGCMGVSQVDVDVQALPQPVISGVPIFCPGDTASLSTQIPYVAYQWSTGSTMPSIELTTAETVQVTVTDANGCREDTTFTITQFQEPNPQILGDLEFCSGDSVQLQIDQAYSNYQWSNGASSDNVFIKSGGTFSVTVTDDEGCRGVDDFDLVENALPQPVINGPAEICSYEVASLTVTANFSSYEWQNGSSTPNFETNLSGLYSVSVRDGKGCLGSDTFNLTVNQAPKPEIVGDRTFCQGDTLRVEADQDYALYSWSNGDLGKSTGILIPGRYGLTVTDFKGCIGDTSLTPIQFSKPTPAILGDTEFCEGQSVELSLDRTYQTYNWTDGSSSPTIQVDSGGTYTVTITDAVGCDAEASYLVTENPLPEPIISGPAEICSYETASLNVQGGFSSYQWQDGTMDLTIDINQSGTYSVSVTDTKGCLGVDTLEFLVNQAPSPSIQGSTLFCRGDTTSLDAENINYVNYQWNNGASTPSIDITAGGDYTLTVTDVNGCEGIGSFTSSIKELPIPTIDGPMEFCENESTQVQVQETYVNYLWSTGENTPSVSISQAGTYFVTVLDGDGCEGQQSVSIIENPNPQPNIMGDRIFCSNESTNISVESNYSVYLWSTGERSVNIFATQPGNYQVTVIDDKGCSGSTSVDLSTLQAPEPEIIGDQTFCEGDTIGFGLSESFRAYNWSNGLTTRNIEVTLPDNYRVTVTDDNGCQGETTFQAIQFSKPRPVIEGQTAFCEGTVTNLFTQQTYVDYQWSNGSNTRQLTVSEPGTYSVTVVDNIGCVGSSDETVIELQNPEPQIGGDTLLCTGETTILDAGTGYFTYIWDNGNRDQTLNVSQSGSYQVTVFDSQGCSGEDVVEVNIFERPDPIIDGGDKFCPGDTIQIGVASFAAYAWSNGDQAQQINITEPGDYRVTVTNAANCTAEASILVEAFDRPILEVEGDRFFCENSFTVLTATSGYPQYEWSNGSSNSVLMINSPGNYQLEITDVNGCKNQLTAEILEIPTPEPQISGPPNLCSNESTILRVNDDYSNYSWSTGGSTPGIEIQQAGFFEISVTDDFGCIGTDTLTVTALVAPDPTLDGDEDFCPGDSVLLSINDVYQSYNWSDGVSDPSRFIKDEGLYVVQVFADNGCKATLSKRVRARPSPDFEIAGDTTFCEDKSTILSVPDTFSVFLWSTGDTSNVLEVGLPGVYGIELFNEFGCSASKEVEVVELEVIDPILPQEANVCTGDSLILNAGNNYREYLWDDGSTEAIRLVTQAGIYSVTLTNTNGCVQELESEVQETTPVFPEIIGANAVCEGQGLGLFVRGNFTNYQWSTNDTTRAVTVRDAGRYRVTVTDLNGCLTTDEKAVDLLPSPKVDLNGLPYFCEGSSTILSVEVEGGDFEWADGQTSDSIIVNRPGNYGVFVRSSNGCNVVEQVTVEEFRNPRPAISGVQEICSDEETTLDAGNEFLRYEWSTGANEQIIRVANEGIYRVIVTDSSGCQGQASFNLQVNEVPEPIIVGNANLCPGDSVELGLSGPYVAYEWSNGDLDSTIRLGESGIYFVEVTDQNGCKGIGNFNLRDAQKPVINLLGDSVLCEGGLVQMGVEGDFATIRWFDGRGGQSIEIFNPGDYSVTVSNDEGCEQDKVFSIQQVARPIADAGLDMEADCTEPAISLDGSASSTGPQYAYEWTGPDIDKDNQNLLQPLVNVSGRYRLTVKDTINGCVSAVDEVLVTFRNEAPNAMTYSKGVITCDNDTVSLGADPLSGTANYSFRWFDPDGNEISPDSGSNYFTNQSGIHSVTIIDQVTGCSSVKTLNVEENLLAPNADAGPDVFLKCNEPTTALDGTNSDQGDSYSIFWRSLEGFPIIDSTSLSPRISRAGDYVLTIRRLANGCISNDTVRAQTDTLIPVADAGVDARLSCNDPFIRLDGTGSQANGDLTYRWTSPDHPDFLAISAQPAVNKAGTYFLKIEDVENGCIDFDSVFVEDGGAGPEELFFSLIPPSCLGDTDGSIIVDSARGGMEPYMYRFELGRLGATNRWNNLGAGEYRIIVEDSEGCEYLQRVSLPDGGVLSVDLGPDQEIRKGYSAEIEPFLPPINPADLDSILWSPLDDLECLDGNCINVSVSPLFSTTYTLRIIDSKGCEAEDQVRIILVDSADVYIPNAFSPNGDGANDQFTVYSSQFVDEIVDMQIYDRWGNRLFQRSNFPPNEEGLGWDGTFRRKAMNPGVFVFKILVLTKDGEKKEYKGDVTLVR